MPDYVCSECTGTRICFSLHVSPLPRLDGELPAFVLLGELRPPTAPGVPRTKFDIPTWAWVIFSFVTFPFARATHFGVTLFLAQSHIGPGGMISLSITSRECWTEGTCFQHGNSFASF